MRRLSSRRVKSLTLAALGVLVVVAAASGAGWLRDQQQLGDARNDSELQRQGCPEGHVTALRRYYFEQLDQMVARSDLVIQARVTRIAPGPFYRRENPAPALPARSRYVTLTIDEVLRSDEGSVPANVTLEEWGWDSTGRCLIRNGWVWSERGDKGYYFLAKQSTGTYEDISAQGRFLVSNGDLVAPRIEAEEVVFETDLDLERSLAGLSPREFEMRVRQISRDLGD